MDAGYDAGTASGPQWSKDADRDLASETLSDGFREPWPRPRTVRLPSQLSSRWTPPVRSDLADELPRHEIGSAATPSWLSDDVDQDPDSVDTAPTRIPAQVEVSTERLLVEVSTLPAQAEVITERPLAPTRSGRHAAVDAAGDDADFIAIALQPRAPGELAIHLPLADPYQVPDGYPVKANASFGLYYMPDSVLYEDTLAEIWFANEEIARANGFIKAG
jgi:hypothetical protein